MRRHGIHTDENGEKYVWIPSEPTPRWKAVGFFPRILGQQLYVDLFDGEECIEGWTLALFREAVLSLFAFEGLSHEDRMEQDAALDTLIAAGLFVEDHEGVHIVDFLPAEQDDDSDGSVP